jgi:hypothetical protein
MDRRAFLKYTGVAGLELGALATALSAAPEKPAGAAVNWAVVKGKFNAELHSRVLGHQTGTLTIKKNKASREAGWRELTGQAKSPRGKLKGWVGLRPDSETAFGIGRVTTKRGKQSYLEGTGEASPDGTTFAGTYRYYEGEPGGALHLIDAGSFVLERA